MRATAILAIERGHWRFVHWHLSIGQANETALGKQLTTSIARVERVVRDDRPDIEHAAAPDGTVTIVFSDIESSTVLLERLGDTGYLRMLAWHDGIVRCTTAEHRGYVVKSQGDGFMLAFPSAAFALRASLVMRERVAAGFERLPIRIRAGLHVGEAIRHDDDFFGRTVVIAARISGLALGGEILVSDLVYALLRGLGTFNFGPPRSVVLKGFDATFDVYPVLA
jgi:class 3 adenylate cyclase